MARLEAEAIAKLSVLDVVNADTCSSRNRVLTHQAGTLPANKKTLSGKTQRRLSSRLTLPLGC